jgi:DNA gyrase subunit A
VYQLKMYDVPEGKRATKGKSIMNFLSIEQGENITSILAMPKEVKAQDGLTLLMATKDGTVKKTTATQLSKKSDARASSASPWIRATR